MGKSSYLHKLHNYTDEELAKTGVYAIVSTVNNKVYIGSASHLSKINPSHSGFWGRWNMHLNHLKRNKHHSKYLQRHFNKYGIDCLRFKILGFYNPEFCQSKELEWIDLLDSVKSGFNESRDTKIQSGKENPHYKHIDKNELIKKYTEVRHIGITAKYFNVGEEKIRTMLYENNIVVRRRHYTYLNYKDIYNNEYISQGISIRKLASKYNVDKGTIVYNFKKFGYKYQIQ
jgi:phage antirepressor YoqD-like protein